MKNIMRFIAALALYRDITKRIFDKEESGKWTVLNQSEIDKWNRMDPDGECPESWVIRPTEIYNVRVRINMAIEQADKLLGALKTKQEYK